MGYRQYTSRRDTRCFIGAFDEVRSRISKLQAAACDVFCCVHRRRPEVLAIVRGTTLRLCVQLVHRRFSLLYLHASRRILEEASGSHCFEEPRRAIGDLVAQLKIICWLER
jgi:hypothetical protein